MARRVANFRILSVGRMFLCGECKFVTSTYLHRAIAAGILGYFRKK